MTEEDNGPDYETLSDSPRVQMVLVAIFLVIVAGGIVDLILDKPDTLLSGHVLFEAGMVLVSLGAASYLARGWFRAQRTAQQLEATVGLREAERDAWRDRAGRTLAGLSEAIDGQFSDWHLTPAERQTALMLLKGHSHKRIGKETDRSERTVRQHSVAVYRKSGLAGRAELAGFFLGDLSLEGRPARADRSARPL